MVWPDDIVSLDDLGDVSDHGRAAADLDTRIALKQALIKLPLPERRAFLLSESGHSDEEIASVLGVSRRWAVDLRHRAKDSLRALLT